MHLAVLLVEDDHRLATFVSGYLVDHGLMVTPVTHGEAALRELRARHYDVVVLDVMLPGQDGFAVCKAIREHWDIPVLLVTARGEEPDRVLGLELGADDYIVKPFSPRELLARLRAFVRRHRGELAPKLTATSVGPLALDESTHVATLEGARLELSPIEFTLLAKLMERPGRVLTREQLLELVKGNAEDAYDRAIDVQVSRLRVKLGERGHTLIRTIRGVGYMLHVEDA
jgi:DNA-binding response OmpR family regulator